MAGKYIRIWVSDSNLALAKRSVKKMREFAKKQDGKDSNWIGAKANEYISREIDEFLNMSMRDFLLDDCKECGDQLREVNDKGICKSCEADTE